MGSAGETIELPFVDFSSPQLKPGTREWESVKNQVRIALEEFGCFEAKFDKIPLQLRKAVFDASEELFNLDLEVKLRNSTKRPIQGYIGQRARSPLFESMLIDDLTIPEELNVKRTISEQVESFTNLLWPAGNSNFCKTLQSYSEQLSELDQIVRRMILESLGVEKYMDEHMESTKYIFKVLKYAGPQTTETKLGVKAHTDLNILTILCQNKNGLELLTKDGQWFDVKTSSESFVVQIGESLAAWTNGRLHCPYHRVMMTGNEARYSAGLFSLPKARYIVKAPEELVDYEHPLLFKPFDYDGLLSFYSQMDMNARKSGELALEIFSGV